MAREKFERNKPHVNIGTIGHVVIEMEPGEPGSGFEFVNKIVGGVVPKEYMKPAEQGMKETCESGVIAGYPLIDV